MQKSYKVFVINLDRSVDRWANMHAQLEKLGMPYERSAATDGKSCSDAFLSSYYSAILNKKHYFVGLSCGEIACYISHLKVCQKIVDLNLDYGIVLEDDIELNPLFYAVPFALNAIKHKWNYIKLMAPFKAKKALSRTPFAVEIPATCTTEKFENQNIAKSEKQIMAPFVFELVKWNKPPMGMQAYAITKEGAKEILAKRSRFFRPIDVDLQYTWETSLAIDGLCPFLCKVRDIESDIGHKKAKYHSPFARVIYKLKYMLLRAKHLNKK